MGNYTGMEPDDLVPEKVKKMYAAVISMVHEGVDLSNCKVIDITQRANIGKGTAYEYFVTREDIIVAAVVNTMKKLSEWLWTKTMEKEGFFERTKTILDIIEDKMGTTECFVRFTHMMTEKNIYGNKLREIGKNEEISKIKIQYLLKNMLIEGLERGELRDDLPMEYMENTLYSRILGYMVFTHFTDNKIMENEEMKNRILCGINAEFGK